MTPHRGHRGLSLAHRLILAYGAAGLFERLTPEERLAFAYSREAWQRPSERLPDPLPSEGLKAPGWGIWSGQQEPPGKWLYWILCAGRSFGKSWCLSQFILDRARRFPGCRIALVAQTVTSLWRDCVGGKSGLLELAPPWFPATPHRNGKAISFPNGSVVHLFTAEVPTAIKGPNNDFAAVEELCAQPYAEAVWGQLQMTMRSGLLPQTIVATTPQPPIPLLIELVQHPSSAVTYGSTMENRGNVSEAWIQQRVLPLLGSQFGAEEVEGRIVLQAEGALFRKEWFDAKWVPGRKTASKYRKIGIGVDPAETSGSKADSWGIVAAALREDGLIEVLEDATVNALPEEAGQVAADCYHRWGASFMVADVGRSGKMVRGIMKLIDPKVHVIEKGGNLGKEAWARPAAVLYAKHLVFHSHPLPELEQQCCRWTDDVKAWSPDRMDALAYVISELSVSVPKQGGLNSEPSSPRRI